MSQENIDLLRRAWAAYDGGDEEGFAACLTEDWLEYGSSGESVGFDGERETMRLHRVAFPDKHTDIYHVVADDEFVACHCSTSATHSGTYFDAQPSGKKVVIHEMMFNRVRDGRLCETWAMVDGPGFYEQITGRSAPPSLDNMG